MKVTAMISLSWPRDQRGYEIIEQPGDPARGALTGRHGGTYIVRRGGEFEFYEPLKIVALYHRLADCEPTPEGALKFIGRFGVPTAAKADQDSYPAVFFPDLVHNIRYAIKAAERSEWRKLEIAFNNAVKDHPLGGLGGLNPLIAHEAGDGRPTLFLQPRSLLSAIWFQFMSDCASGVRLRQCAHCGDWFKYGPGSNPPKRNTAMFCSSRCQGAHAYAKRKAVRPR